MLQRNVQNAKNCEIKDGGMTEKDIRITKMLCAESNEIRPLSYIIIGGSAPVNQVKPKTWWIFTFAEANCCAASWPLPLTISDRTFE
jgi:hypothetical protein